LIRLRIGIIGEPCEFCIEPPGFISHGVSYLVKHTGNGYLGRPRRRWENNIRMDLKEIGINNRNFVYSSQDRNYLRTLVNFVLNLRVP
jgi:hypothetical protein